MFSVWIRASLGRRIDFGGHLPEVNDLQELKIMMTDRLEEWAKEREAKGLQQGRQAGRQTGRQTGRRSLGAAEVAGPTFWGGKPSGAGQDWRGIQGAD